MECRNARPRSGSDSDLDDVVAQVQALRADSEHGCVGVTPVQRRARRWLPMLLDEHPYDKERIRRLRPESRPTRYSHGGCRGSGSCRYSAPHWAQEGKLRGARRWTTKQRSSAAMRSNSLATVMDWRSSAIRQRWNASWRLWAWRRTLAHPISVRPSVPQPRLRRQVPRSRPTRRAG